MAAFEEILMATIILLATYIIYRFHFDSLSSYPGPKLWALTQFPWHLHNIKGTLQFRLEELHERYGPAVRVGPNEISYAATSSGTWKAVHAHKPEMQKNWPGTGMVGPPRGKPGLLTAGTEAHTRMRKTLFPAFSDKALRAQEDLINVHVQKLLTIVSRAASDSSSPPTDLALLFSLTTYDVISDLAFGETFGGLDNVQMSPWVAGILRMVKFAPYVQLIAHWGLFELLFKMAAMMPKSLQPKESEHRALPKRKVDARLKSQDAKGRSDFLGFMLPEGRDGEASIEMDELYSNAVLLTNAGAETTATLLMAVMYHLLTNPEPYEKLKSEIRSTFKRADEINMISAGSLKYLGCVVQEALRMHPPLPATSSRVVPGEGEMIAGRWVSGGTAVGINHWSTYHLSSNFHDAARFVPERWLPDRERPPQYQDDHRDVLQPFSYGNRNCLGQGLAHAEAHIIISRLVFNFDFELLPESRNWPDQKAWLSWERAPLLVRVKARSAGR